jgi:hypothetical protein
VIRVAPPAVAPRVFAPARPAVRTRVPPPWPVWLGVALIVAGALGGGIRVRLRARRAAGRVAATV